MVCPDEYLRSLPSQFLLISCFPLSSLLGVVALFVKFNAKAHEVIKYHPFDFANVLHDTVGNAVTLGLPVA